MHQVCASVRCNNDTYGGGCHSGGRGNDGAEV